MTFLPGILLAAIVSITAASAQSTVVRAQRMLDVQSGRIVSPAVVVVSGNSITAINPALLPTGASTIDLGDVTLLPGFIDMHVHVLLDGLRYRSDIVSETGADAVLQVQERQAVLHQGAVADRDPVDVVEDRAERPHLGAETRSQIDSVVEAAFLIGERHAVLDDDLPAGHPAVRDAGPGKATDLLNDRVLPFFEEQGVELLRVLTDRGTEYCGNPERHEYELYLAVEDIDHSRTKTKSPQTNGIVERFHKTALNEFYRIAFRKKLYRSIEDLQADLDIWLAEFNDQRPHQGRWCFGKTPMQTFLDARPIAQEKMIAA